MIPNHPAFADMPEAFLDALGTPVIVTIGGNPPKALRAIVRGPWAQIAAAGGYSAAGATGRMVTVSFAETDVPGIVENATRVNVGGGEWLVKEPLPDGRGMVRAELELA